MQSEQSTTGLDFGFSHDRAETYVGPFHISMRKYFAKLVNNF